MEGLFVPLCTVYIKNRFQIVIYFLIYSFYFSSFITSSCEKCITANQPLFLLLKLTTLSTLVEASKIEPKNKLLTKNKA